MNAPASQKPIVIILNNLFSFPSRRLDVLDSLPRMRLRGVLVLGDEWVWIRLVLVSYCLAN